MEFAWCVIQTADGGYALAGYIAPAGPSAWLVKTDADSNEQWNKTYGETGAAYSVIQTADAGYALAGSSGGYDFWLVKTDSNGNTQWNKTYSDDDWDGANCLVQTADQGYALAGYSQNIMTGECDGWLVKTDSAGNVDNGFKFGLAWTDSTLDTITLFRGATARALDCRYY